MLLDADALFFRRPDLIIDWLDRPEDQRILYSVEAYIRYWDSKKGWAYRDKPRRTLNAGLMCYPKERLIDLDKINIWVGQNPDLLYMAPTFEQLCYSFLTYQSPDRLALPVDKYTFNDDRPGAVCTHYAMKRFFFLNIRRLQDDLI